MEKDEVSGYQGRRAGSAEMLTANVQHRNGNAATYASPESTSPRSTPWPRKSLPLSLPFLGFVPGCRPHPDVAYFWQLTNLYPGTPLRWGPVSSHSFSKRFLFCSPRPQTLSFLVESAGPPVAVLRGWVTGPLKSRPAVHQTEEANHRTLSHTLPAAGGTTNSMKTRGLGYRTGCITSYDAK